MKDKKQVKTKGDLKGFNELSELIQKSINTSMSFKEEWTQRNSFLFKQRERLTELWNMWKNADPIVLNAFLVFQSYRYREELTPESLVEKIKSEIEANEEELLEDLDLKKYQNAEKFIISLLDELEQNQDLELKTPAIKVARFLAKNLQKIFNIMTIRHQQQENYKENMLLMLRQEHFIKYDWKKKIFVLSALVDGISYARNLSWTKTIWEFENNTFEEYLNGLLSEMAEEVIKNKEKYEHQGHDNETDN